MGKLTVSQRRVHGGGDSVQVVAPKEVGLPQYDQFRELPCLGASQRGILRGGFLIGDMEEDSRVIHLPGVRKEAAPPAMNPVLDHLSSLSFAAIVTVGLPGLCSTCYSRKVAQDDARGDGVGVTVIGAVSSPASPLSSLPCAVLPPSLASPSPTILPSSSLAFVGTVTVGPSKAKR